MALFFNQKPRSFHHEYIYVDERKEFLEKLKVKHNKKKLDLIRIPQVLIRTCLALSRQIVIKRRWLNV